jgi:transcriptional regulator with XRE-family HTH domain
MKEKGIMSFGEKVRELRIRNGYSQDQLARMTGVTKRTVRNWETEGKYPRSQALYTRLASALGCNEEYLRGEQELFLTRAAEQYGTRGQQQAQAFLDSTRAMFAGGDLSPEDIDMIGKHFMEMFWEAKENAKKYTPLKYRDAANGSSVRSGDSPDGGAV